MLGTICDLLRCDFPLLAFSHCRDVVAAVTNAGGFGVLGATSHGPEELEQELQWIDKQVAGRPYGVDLVIPGKAEGKGEQLAAAQLASRIPEGHREFTRALLTRHGVDATGLFEEADGRSLRVLPEHAEPLLDVCFRHPIKLVANALGVPPPFLIDRAKAEGVPVAALVGAREHALKQVQAGVDVLVAQGTEAGGHTGEVTTLVLVPEILQALKDQRPVPVLAAGGIATGRQIAAVLALGAAGAWTGSVWLTTAEAETPPATKEKLLSASSRDTVRSRGRTGKPSRQLRSAWTEAWDDPAGPGALAMPLQGMISHPAFRRIDAAAQRGVSGARELASYYVGQAVGLMNQPRTVREVMYDLMEDFAAAVDRLERLTGR